MIPYVMRGRNESAVWHEQHYDLSKTRPWLDAWNDKHRETPASLFHLLMYSLGRVFHERPGLNRFVSGGRIYQRNHVELSFSVKPRMEDSAPLATVKLRIPREQPFAAFLERITSATAEARAPRETAASRARRRLLALPGPIVGAAMSVLRTLDAANLLSDAFIDRDTSHTTAFVENLGSVGVDHAFHHMQEHGTASFVGSLGRTKRDVVVGRDGKPTVRESVQVRWSFDERINDGFYCASALKIPQRIVEDPDSHDAGAFA
jgi:hypothetical protein